MDFFIKIVIRLAAVMSATALFLMVISVMRYNGHTVMISFIGIALWLWFEVDERKTGNT